MHPLQKQPLQKRLRISFLGLVVFLPSIACATDVTRVSTTALGEQLVYGSQRPKLSGDGHYVVFDSFDSNLIENNFNKQTDVFRKDTRSGGVILVSVNVDVDGYQTNRESINADISRDGKYVVFQSFSNVLVNNDRNGFGGDVFRKNLDIGEVMLVSANGQGTGGLGGSSHPSISADGRFVVFYSVASNLVENDKNDMGDIFLKDMDTGNISRVNTTVDGTEAINTGFTSTGVATISFDQTSALLKVRIMLMPA